MGKKGAGNESPHRIAPAVYCLLLLLLFTASCKKEFLNRDPYGGLPTPEAITTVEDMGAALNGIYATLRDESMYGRFVPLFGDLFADNVYLSTTNSNRYTAFFQVNMTVSNLDVANFWENSYNAILNANNVINSTLAATPQTSQYKGEALALRALLYFELVKHFARPYTLEPNGLGVPLILTYDPFKKPARNTVQEVYAQIGSDLAAAIPLMTQQRSSGYFSAAAAQALLARMHQFKGEWNEALAVAEDVVQNSGYSLLGLNGVPGYWSQNTVRNDGLETLFEVVFDLVGNTGNDALAYFYSQEGYGDALASEDLYQTYSATDVRRSLILTESPIRGDVKVVNKYPNTTQPDKDEFKVLRLSEVALIAAEAAYHTGQPALALQWVNEIAARRDAQFVPYTSSGAQLLEDILLERRKELAFEGHRYWDLARYNRDVVRVNLEGNYPGVPLVIPTNSFRRVLPIPQSELDANPNIRGQQNQGY